MDYLNNGKILSLVFKILYTQNSFLQVEKMPLYVGVLLSLKTMFAVEERFEEL